MRCPGSPAATRLARWLLESADARPLLGAELGLSPRAVPRYGLRLDKVTGLPPLGGNVDVLLADPRDPRDATVMELRRVTLPAVTRGVPVRLPVAELAMTVRHVNRLAEVGFCRLWLLLCLMADDVAPGDPFAILDQVDEGPIPKLLHLSVGLAFALVPRVPSTAPCEPVSVRVRRAALPIRQGPRVTLMVARLYEPAQ